jgi:hypothetical protein
MFLTMSLPASLAKTLPAAMLETILGGGPHSLDRNPG